MYEKTGFILTPSDIKKNGKRTTGGEAQERKIFHFVNYGGSRDVAPRKRTL